MRKCYSVQSVIIIIIVGQYNLNKTRQYFNISLAYAWVVEGAPWVQKITWLEMYLVSPCTRSVPLWSVPRVSPCTRSVPLRCQCPRGLWGTWHRVSENAFLENGIFEWSFCSNIHFTHTYHRKHERGMFYTFIEQDNLKDMLSLMNGWP